MERKIRYLTMAILLGACASSLARQEKFTIVRMRSVEYEGDTQKEVTYLMDVPKGAKFTEVNLSHGKEKRIEYRDGSILYISDDEWRGSGLNFSNRVSIGHYSYHKEILYDTLNNAGQQSDGNHWREYVVGQVVVGYVNIPKDRKELFDQALATIRKE